MPWSVACRFRVCACSNKLACAAPVRPVAKIHIATKKYPNELTYTTEYLNFVIVGAQREIRGADGQILLLEKANGEEFGMLVRRLLGGSALVALGMFSAAGAWALETDPVDAGSTVDGNEAPGDTERVQETIYVTAQRRSESLADVPVAITAFTDQQLEQQGVTDTLELSKVVPGLHLAQDAGSAVIYIRGIGTDITSPGVEPSVATYVDGAYIPSPELVFGDYFNVAQVEVLRGPQGTLFGRNATGGAINLTTRGPTDEFEGTVGVSTSDQGLKRAYGIISGPFTDKIRGSLAAVTNKRDGEYHDIVTSREFNGLDYYSVQGRLLAELSDSFEVELFASHFDQDDSDGTAMTELSGSSLPAFLGAPVGTRPYETATELPDLPGVPNLLNRKKVTTFGLRAEWDIGNITLRSRTNHIEYDKERYIDVDLSPLPLQGLMPVYEGEYLTQEFLLAPSTSGEKVEWVAGVFYIDASDGLVPLRVSTMLDLDMDLTPETPGFAILQAKSETESYAIFGDITYHIDENWSVAAGARYSDEEKSITDRGVGAELAFGTLLAPLATFPDASKSWDDVTWRALVKYDNGPFMAFAKVETGQVAGVFNTANPINPGPVDPEEVTAYEVGFKSSAMNGVLNFESSVFFNDYNDIHIQIVDATTGASILDQAKAAESYGVDFQMRAQPVDNLDVSLGVSYLNAEYKEYTTGGILIPAPVGNTLPSSPMDLSGNVRPRSPEWTTNLSVNYTIPLSRGDIVASGNAYTSSDVYFDPGNYLKQDGYSLLNGQIAYHDRSGVSVSVWGRNLTDERYLSSALAFSTAVGGFYANPRTYGVTLSWDF